MIPIKQNLIKAERYSAQSPFSMKPQSITIHNTYNDASAVNEIANLKNNYQTTSFHYAVDDIQAVQYIPDNRNAHHAGDGRNGKGNRTSLSIEICYSKSGGARFIQAEKNAAVLTAHLLKRHGLGIQNVVPHKYWTGKYCPHRTLDMGWDRFIAMVKAEMGGSSASSSKPAPSSSKPEKIDEDKRWGRGTTTLTQIVLGVAVVDGEIWSQYAPNKKYIPNATGGWAWVYSANGSPTIVAIQALVGEKKDGILGKKTVIAIQIFLRAQGLYTGKIDGIAGTLTVLGWQKYVNSRI